ncbi:hypothetical protein GPECTOR_6g476 [Gonium pectorale]|uniref:Uncharacterized protein n=1 Tax=Gonium pectorale TaxID=33097 RepID=A0A150GW20_GONPE|nr:hypothetical protein GPECTOR_6g476 [Gonium pectorale]|eukprot:KXZ53560.1 hypothetical protein GPECTOR_6g476 [Gonium pectorale]
MRGGHLLAAGCVVVGCGVALWPGRAIRVALPRSLAGSTVVAVIGGYLGSCWLLASRPAPAAAAACAASDDGGVHDSPTDAVLSYLSPYRMARMCALAYSDLPEDWAAVANMDGALAAPYFRPAVRVLPATTGGDAANGGSCGAASAADSDGTVGKRCRTAIKEVVAAEVEAALRAEAERLGAPRRLRVVLAGHSLGGYLAQHVGLRLMAARRRSEAAAHAKAEAEAGPPARDPDPFHSSLEVGRCLAFDAPGLLPSDERLIQRCGLTGEELQAALHAYVSYPNPVNMMGARGGCTADGRWVPYFTLHHVAGPLRETLQYYSRCAAADISRIMMYGAAFTVATALGCAAAYAVAAALNGAVASALGATAAVASGSGSGSRAGAAGAAPTSGAPDLAAPRAAASFTTAAAAADPTVSTGGTGAAPSTVAATAAAAAAFAARSTRAADAAAAQLRTAGAAGAAAFSAALNALAMELYELLSYHSLSVLAQGLRSPSPDYVRRMAVWPEFGTGLAGVRRACGICACRVLVPSLFSRQTLGFKNNFMARRSHALEASEAMCGYRRWAATGG